MRVVFMGTPAFAVPVLEALVEAPDVDVPGVVTPPDRPGGRGRNPVQSPVKSYALAQGLPVLQPQSLRPEAAQRALAVLSPDVIVVAAFGRILPPPTLALPPHGCLNLHPSLLPRHRGPAPVVTAILEGDRSTGVTLMQLNQEMDTGPLISNRRVELTGSEDAETLTWQLFRLGAGLLLDDLGPWAAGELTARPQIDGESTVTRKVERDDGRADWAISAEQLERRCRAYKPWPGLYTQWDGKILKLLDVVVLEPGVEAGHGERLSPGSVGPTDCGEAPLGVTTGQGILGLKTVQLEGRKAVAAAEFARGFPGILGAQL